MLDASAGPFTAIAGATLAVLFAAAPLTVASAATTRATPPNTELLSDPFEPVPAAVAGTTAPSTTPGSNGDPFSDGSAPSTTAPVGTGDDLASTGASSLGTWFALGALAAIALGLALRPHQRPFPERA